MYDLIIIGSGPGGYEAAAHAGARGLRVLLFEENKIGGVCLHCGCIPTKILLKSAHVYHESRQAEIFGVKTTGVDFDWSAMLKRRDEIVAQLTNGVAGLLKKNKVEIINARAQLTTGGKVVAADQEYEAKNILLATGSRPAKPPISGIEAPNVVDSTAILALPEIPQTLCVIGGGALGLEFASLFNTLGVPVTVLEMLPQIGGALDSEIAKRLQQNLSRAGITFHLSIKDTCINGDTVTFTDKNGAVQTVRADKILCATGRRPNLENLGLAENNLIFDKRGIKIDEFGKTNIANIWAGGDVVGGILLAHVATYECLTVVENILGGNRRLDYRAVPSVIYTAPEVASVGASEEQLKARAIKYRKISVPLGIAGRFLIEYPAAAGTLKILLDEATTTILGVHILGGAASEMLYGATMMVAQKMTPAMMKEVIFPHPTISEAISIALRD